jgi:hypothetical protein
MAPNAKHSSESVHHDTPQNYLDAAREVLGGIELDPASCAQANEMVRAARFYTQRDNSLRRGCDWTSRTAWLNPPGGSTDNERSLAKAFWFRLAAEWHARRVGAAMFLGFSIEILQSTQNRPTGPIPLDFPFCIPRERIPFWVATEEPASKLRQSALFVGEVDEPPPPGLVAGDAPTHANVLVLLPPIGPEGPVMTRSFQRVFTRFGKVVVP